MSRTKWTPTHQTGDLQGLWEGERLQEVPLCHPISETRMPLLPARPGTNLAGSPEPSAPSAGGPSQRAHSGPGGARPPTETVRRTGRLTAPGRLRRHPNSDRWERLIRVPADVPNPYAEVLFGH